MSEQQKGIQETKEVLEGALLIAGLVIKQVKDGVQFADIPALFSAIQDNPENKAVIETAMKDISKVPGEVLNPSLGEIVELVGVVVKAVPGLIEALAKPKV